MGASSSADGRRVGGAQLLGPNTNYSSYSTALRGQPSQSPDFSLLESILQDPSKTPISLPMDFLKAITSDFSEAQELGRGGFGVVYKGVLQNGKAIAVKKLLELNDLDDDQFQKEVTNLFGLEHKNIVQLVGYCAESRWEAAETNGRYVMAEVRKRLICFEYVNKLSLDKHLPAESHGLEWHTGYQIVKGICHGLHYLHTECQIVHLDIKPQNILLDENMEPKITDFGMSRLFGTQQSRIITQSRGGTRGYMAPEYLANGLISIKADIFSLGVIIIELMTGSRYYPSITEENYEHFIENVVGSWRKRLETGRYKPLEQYVEQVKKCILIALMCVHAEPNKRPTAQDVVGKLTEADVTTPEQRPQGNQHASESVDPPNRPLLKRFRGLFKNILFISSRTNMLASQPESQISVGQEPTSQSKPVAHQLVHLDGSIAFTMEDLLVAEAEVLGKGTYGTVYKATLDTGIVLAIKRLRQEMIKGHEEFKTEFAVLGKVRHPNLLAPRAYHLGQEEVFVVYDYMPKGSLSDLLHGGGGATNSRVDWATRMAIATGTARGLAYLHDDMSITHGNLTARNVLLDFDEQSEPKIADFGLFGVMTTAANTNRLAAAREQGYRAPELLVKASTKTDVYSLGIIILQLLTGKSPSDVDMARWVASVLREEWVSEVFDVDLMRDLLKDSGPSEDDLMRTMTVALQCVGPSPSVRPTAREVLGELDKIRQGPETASGQSQDSSPSVQLEVPNELDLESEQVRPSPEEDGARTSDDYLPFARNRAIYDIQVSEELRRLRRTGPEPAEQPEQLEDGSESGLTEHQSPLVGTEAQEVLEHGLSGPEEDVQEDAFEQPGHIRSTPEDDMVPSSPAVPTETQEVLEEISLRSLEDGANSSGGPLGPVQIEGWEVSQQPEHIHGEPEDGSRPSNPSLYMQPDDLDMLQPRPPEHILSGPDDGARLSAEQLPSTQPEDPEVLQQPEQIGSGTEDGAVAVEVLEHRSPGSQSEQGAETNDDLSAVPEEREAQAAVLEELEEGGAGPEYGTDPTEDDPPPSLRPEDAEVESQQREHVQAEADDDVSGQSGQGTRPVIFSFFLICLPFLVRE